MRPLELKMSGFTCFRDEVTIPLAGFGVFAIAGATGAGKSSILDAMIFALYGKVPRVGKGCTDLISLGKDRLSVTLTFEIRNRKLMVTRTLRRKGAADAQLDEEDTSIAGGVTDVNRQIEQLVGMPYETFLQAVVLPQGDFAQFLHSTGSQRTTILGGLLRLEVYERMRKAASQEGDGLGQGVALLQKQLDTDYVDATPGTVASIEGELETCGVENEKREAAITARTAEVNRLRSMRTKTAELDVGNAERERLLGEQEHFSELRRELDAAERALQIEALLHEATTKRKERATRQSERSDAEQGTKMARATHAQRLAERATAERDAKEVPKLRAHVQALDKIMGLIDAARAEHEQLGTAQNKLDAANKALAKSRRDLPRLERTSASLSAALEGADARIKEVGYDAKRATQLEAGRKDAQRLAQLRATSDQRSAELSKANKGRETKERELEGLRDALDVAQKEEAGATTKRVKLEQGLDAAQRNDHVRALHEVLVAGEACPVCDQKVKVIPKKPRAQELDELEDRVASAEKDERRAIDGCTKIRTRLERMQGDLDEAKKEAAAAQKRHESHEKDVVQAETSLEKKIGRLLEQEGGETIEVRVESALDAIATAREAYEAAMSARTTAQDESNAAREALNGARADQSKLETTVATLISQIETSREKLDKWASKISDVTTHPEPHVEREELSERADTLQLALTTAKDNEQTANAQLGHANVLLEGATERANAAEHAAVEADATADEAARQRAFSGIEDARGAIRPEARRKQLRVDVETFDRKIHALADRIAALEKVLGDQRVSADELHRAEEELGAMNGSHGEAKERMGALKQQLATAKQRLEQAAKLRAEVEERSGKRSIYVQLAKDLGRSEFQQFMLRETVNELVARASERLLRLSGERYALVVRDDDFYVVDNANAGEERPAVTLSGGETFLASLALALELSEQVQLAAGAVHLDSLFVDEGFGSLDPEALNVATEAIESLQVGGRMVGVISHVPELTRRMPKRLLVRKGAGGASIEIES
jgi:exonuclease SbcC